MGLGCWAIGGVWQWDSEPGGWGEVDDAESVRAIRVALDLGINFFDTAANYGTGHSERVLGKALRGLRDQAVIATKFGFSVNETRKRATRFSCPSEVIENARHSCEQSLRRLGTDYIDLYLLHVFDFPAEPAAALREILEAMVGEGKIRAYGWSTDSVELAKVFAEGVHCAAIEHDLNVVLDAPDLLTLCRLNGLASVNRSPLARGALTGKYRANSVFSDDDVRHSARSAHTYFTPVLDRLDAIRELLTSRGRTLAQGCLAWIWARSPITVPIPGFRTVAQVEENAGAMHFGPLAPEEMDTIETLLGR